MYIQSGIGNLGTESVSDCHRVAAEMVGMPWEKVELTWGDTAKNLPWTLRLRRQPDDARDDARGARRGDRRDQEAAGDRREDARRQAGALQVANERVSGPGGSMTLAQAAQKAIELGGMFDGHELPEDINAFTKSSATALAGQGLMGVARDNYKRDGDHALVRRRLRGSRSGPRDRQIPHPRLPGGRRRRHRDPSDALGGQVLGRSMLGIGHAIGQKLGLRPALRRAARQALLPEQAADDSRRAAERWRGPR